MLSQITVKGEVELKTPRPSTLQRAARRRPPLALID